MCRTRGYRSWGAAGRCGPRYVKGMHTGRLTPPPGASVSGQCGQTMVQSSILGKLSNISSSIQSSVAPSSGVSFVGQNLKLWSGVSVFCLDSMITRRSGVTSSPSPSRFQRQYRMPNALRTGQSVATWVAPEAERELLPLFAWSALKKPFPRASGRTTPRRSSSSSESIDRALMRCWS